MPLEIYKRRHSSVCLTEISQQVAAGKLTVMTADEMQQYAECDCAWWVRGVTDEGKTILPRSLKVYTKAAALRAMKELNKSGADILRRVTLEAAKEKWFEEMTTRRLKQGTLNSCELAYRHLQQYLKKHHVTQVREITVDHLTGLRLRWMDELARNTQRTYLTHTKTFLKFCVRRDYIAVDPATKLAPLPKRIEAGEERVEEDENATLPLDRYGHDNYNRVIAGFVPYFKERGAKLQANARLLLRYPENFRVLLQLLYETGLRISDAIKFEPQRMRVDTKGATYTTVQRKTGRSVTVFLPLWLAQAIRALPLLDGAKYPFFNGQGDWDNFVNTNVRDPLREYGKTIGIEGSLRPHRFRDSFAVNRLNEGVSMSDLSTLLGHKNIAMTERYYAPFVTSREVALRQRLLAAQADAPPTTAPTIMSNTELQQLYEA